MLRRLVPTILLLLVLPALDLRAQTISQGQILAGNGSALIPISPFSCYVDGVATQYVSTCINNLTTAGRLGGVITSSSPEHFTQLPWNPATFSGVLQLGNGTNSSSGCSTTVANCWLTDVPIILGSGMRIVGSGKVPTTTGGVSTNGTGIGPSSAFPGPLGQPSFSSANLACVSGTMSAATYLVEVVEVNELDTYPSGMAVPGFSQVSAEETKACGASTSLQVTLPAALTTTPASFDGVECRVFVTTSTGGSGNETLQVPGPDMSCSAGTGTVDSSACKLGTGTQTATITTLQTGGDPPNLIDLSNPLVVDIGGGGSSPGFWAVLQNLTLALPGSAGTNNPNVAFWNPTDQENSGLSFVSFTGQTINTTPSEAGAWIYIGNHAPNSFVSNVQTDTNPTSGSFYGMILDGRPGSGTVGTARVVYNSTFTPARVGGSTAAINAAALVTGSAASVDFIDDHFEVNGSGVTGTKDCIQVTNSANVSAQGPTQFCSPFIHLTSSGNDIGVRNVTTAATPFEVVEDDRNSVTLYNHVSDYSTAKNTPVMTVEGTLNLNGSTSGTVTVEPQPSFTSYGLDLPAAVPANGDLLSCTTVTSTCTLSDSNVGAGDVTTYHAPAAGILRSSSGTQAIAASELSGDATTSGSNVVTVGKINGGAVPASASVLGSNASSQLVAETNVSVTTLSTATNCAAVGTSANPSVASCGGAAAGAFSCATNASGGTCAVDTTAVDANSEIFVVQVESEGSRLGVTCYTGFAVRTSAPLLVTKSSGVGFAINLGTVSTNPACFDYFIVN